MSTRLILRLEGAVTLAAATALYAASGGGPLMFAALFLLPDIFMLGYLANPRLGAAVYNLGHATLLPVATAGLGWMTGTDPVFLVALIWLAHVGFDRMAGYGLKHPDAFRHTHLDMA